MSQQLYFEAFFQEEWKDVHIKSWYTNGHYSSAHAAKTQKAPSCPSSSGYLHSTEFCAVKDELLTQHLG